MQEQSNGNSKLFINNVIGSCDTQTREKDGGSGETLLYQREAKIKVGLDWRGWGRDAGGGNVCLEGEARAFFSARKPVLLRFGGECPPGRASGFYKTLWVYNPAGGAAVNTSFLHQRPHRTLALYGARGALICRLFLEQQVAHLSTRGFLKAPSRGAASASSGS